MNQTNVKFGMTKKTIETALCLSRLSEMNVTASDLSTIEIESLIHFLVQVFSPLGSNIGIYNPGPGYVWSFLIGLSLTCTNFAKVSFSAKID